ncbi:PP2C family protein-serine/threonine phosphatase, partial [Verrucomicrobiota bacterium]
RDLGSIFNNMLDAIRDAMKKLEETTAAKQRIESELNIAREIQMSLLPKIVPPFPNSPEFKIHAVVEPAREVGGDFYDLFFIDDTHFFFAVGDVSGKGVPASLFMAVTKTLLKSSAAATQVPQTMLTMVNNELAPDNDSCMFITVFCGVLDTATGEVVCANAGHNPPLIRRASGTCEFLETPGDMVLGPIEGIVYSTGRFVLAKGDLLLVYSDGITEAADTEGAMFGEDRFEHAAADLTDTAPHKATAALRSIISEFVGNAVQSDDITLLALRYEAHQGRSTEGINHR